MTQPPSYVPTTLLPWIDRNKIDWYALARCNPNASYHLLCQHFRRVPLREMSDVDKSYERYTQFKNTGQLHRLKHVDWVALNHHPNAMKIFADWPEKIDWGVLSYNRDAIPLLEQNTDKLLWSNVCMNPGAMKILLDNYDKINWFYLSRNPSAVPLLEENLARADWSMLSMNPNAMHLVTLYPERIHWGFLSANPSAVDYLGENVDKVVWSSLVYNPNIFVYDYSYLETRASKYKEELVKAAFTPARISAWLEQGLSIDDVCDM